LAAANRSQTMTLLPRFEGTRGSNSQSFS